METKKRGRPTAPEIKWEVKWPELLRWMEKQNVSRTQLAEALGVQYITITGYLDGRIQPSAQRLKPIAQALGKGNKALEAQILGELASTVPEKSI